MEISIDEYNQLIEYKKWKIENEPRLEFYSKVCENSIEHEKQVIEENKALKSQIANIEEENKKLKETIEEYKNNNSTQNVYFEYLYGERKQ